MENQEEAKLATNAKKEVIQKIFELRHQPSGSFLDVRGFVADYIKKKDLFPHWKIDTNIVNFFDENQKIKTDGAFAGYQRAGYVVYNPPTNNYFVDKATKYWKELIKNQHYQIPEPIIFGNRTLTFIPSSITFEEINKRIFENYFSETLRKLIGGKQTDLMITLDSVEDNFDLRIAVGPIHKDEAKTYFQLESEQFKNAGLYIDIDCFKAKDLNHDIINKLLLDSTELTRKKVEDISKSLGIV